MSSTGASNIWTEVPEPVSKAMRAFGLGQLDLSELRAQIVEALRDNPATAEPIHELLDEELKARSLTIADYGDLVEIVGVVVSEHVPTATSGKAPEASGLYRVIDEYTLIPTNITGWGEDEFVEAANAQQESASGTHPLEIEADTQSGDSQDEAAVELVEIGPGSVLRGRFRLEEEVARGSMGIVYRAIDLVKLDAGALDPQLAVKVVSPEFANNKNALRTFQNEVVNSQHLSHPHIIHLFELDRDGDRHFITMEWLEGHSLAELLDNSQGSALPPTQTYAIIEQLCDAMIYAHEQGVVHADIKPGNVFLLETGEVKLIDFGIAKTNVAWQGSAEMDKFQTVALTPAYAGCERLEHEDPTDQDDLYSLACLIYRLLSGRRVFGPLNALEAEEQGAEVVAIDDMDEQRRDALAKALAFRRTDRQASVREFAKEFGRRIPPREPDAEIWEQSSGETARMPVLDVELDAVPELFDADNVDLDLSAAAEAEDGPKPDLHTIFEAAARGEAGIEEDLLAAAQGEEIVLTSEPDQVVAPFQLPRPQIDAVKKRRRRKASLIHALIHALIDIDKKAAVSIAAAIVLVVIAWLWSGGEEEVVPPQTEVAALPVAESVTEAEPAVEQVVQAEAVVAPIAVVEPVLEPVVEPVVQAAPVAEPVTEAEPAVEQVVQAAAFAVPVTEVEPLVEQAALAETAVGPEAPATVAAEITLQGESVAEAAEAAEQDFTDAPAVEGLVVGSLLGAETVAATDGALSDLPELPEQNVVSSFDPNEPVPLSELEFIKFVEPRYPKTMLNRSYNGTVEVVFRVSAEGRTFDVEVGEIDLPGRFKSPSVAAVKKWRFQPYLNDGQPVEVFSRVRLRYAN